MASDNRVYLNGVFLPLAEARVSVLDRGFLFGDGVYEVIPVYGRRPFRLEAHLQRLDRSLAAIRLANPLPHSHWHEVVQTLVAGNPAADQSLYVQITRGVAERDHAMPAAPVPTVFAMSSEATTLPLQQEGISAITVEDIRWKLCHIKTIALMPNVLLRQQAIDAGAEEAIMLRDGDVTEGTASNVFIVERGVVLTPPKGQLLLPGVTRDLVVALCRHHGIPCEQRAIDEASLRGADEVWLTSSTRDIMPVTTLDRQPIATGRPGPIWERLNSYYQEYKQAFRQGLEDHSI